MESLFAYKITDGDFYLHGKLLFTFTEWNHYLPIQLQTEIDIDLANELPLEHHLDLAFEER